MILFVNTFLANEGSKGTNVTYDRGLLPDSDRVDVFKYSLASFAVIPWSQVVIHYDLDTDYQGRRGELDSWIRTHFPEATVHHSRLERQDDWKVALRPILDHEDPLVWFYCNHDHIFIDYELDLLLRIERRLQEMSRVHPYVSCAFSHWPELLAFARDVTSDWRIAAPLLEMHDDYSVFGFRSNDSIQIVNKSVLRYWWYEHDYGDAWLPRSDRLGTRCTGVETPEIRCVVPHRELVRHFDGYSHKGVDIRDCPPLAIPRGFFEQNIRILYCGDEPEAGYVTVNPLKAHYSATDPAGADMRGVLEDLPLFWRSRITETRIGRDVPAGTLLHHRNKAVLQAAWGRMSIPVRQLSRSLRFESDGHRKRGIARLEGWRLARRLRLAPGRIRRRVVERAKHGVMNMVGPEVSRRFHHWRLRRGL